MRWEIARDDGFKRLRRSGQPSPRPIGPMPCMSRWTASSRDAATGTASSPATRSSPVGRTRTAPAPGNDARAAALRLRLLPALRAGLVHRASPHGRPRTSTSSSSSATTSTNRPGARDHVRKHDGGRAVHARATTATATPSYKADPDLQAQPRRRCRGSSPGTTTRSTTTTPTTAPRTAAARTFPRPPRRRLPGLLRAHAAAARRCARTGRTCACYTRLDCGALARFHVLDGRQYRCLPGLPEADARRRQSGRRELRRAPRSGAHAARRRAGALAGRRASPHSRARWNVIAQQTLMAQLGRGTRRARRASGPTAGTATRRRARGCSTRWSRARLANPVVHRRRRARIYVADLQARTSTTRSGPSSRASSAAPRSLRRGPTASAWRRCRKGTRTSISPTVRSAVTC